MASGHGGSVLLTEHLPQYMPAERITKLTHRTSPDWQTILHSADLIGLNVLQIMNDNTAGMLSFIQFKLFAGHSGI